ncbi:acetyl esterase [Lachnospiraceae bacterium PF1-21]|nr:alpha/beta hydrolase [Lachnospiraceae bacterium OttesenSCG-928-J05]
MFLKPKYNYSKELKRPITFGHVNMDKAIENGGMLRSASFMKKQTAKYKTNAVQLEKGIYTSFDGKELDFYSFTPREKKNKYPAIIYYHGGGFMFPIQKFMMENSVRYCENLGVKVFLPEYRISLETSCDTIIEDCYEMLEYVFDNADALGIDEEKVIIYGDSAGGCLAESVSLLNRDKKNHPLCGQMLLYPVCDNESDKYPSIEEYKDAVWNKKANEAMWKTYLKHGTKNKKYVVPINDDLNNLPSAYIEPQEIDILRDEAIAYANKLKSAGVKVEVNIIAGSYHGFDSDFKSPLVQRVYEKRYQVIRKMLNIRQEAK